MSKTSVRIDKTCLNCNHVVEKRFCGNCGQENINTRKTFHHLFIHFFEDLTHYENAFWKTIRNLLFKPSSLTKEYLSGKRMSYLAPVRLYIFISFITFFLIAIIPSKEVLPIKLGQQEAFVSDSTEITESKNNIKIESLLQKSNLSEVEKQTIRKNILSDSTAIKKGFGIGYISEQEFDSIQKYGSEDEKVPKFMHQYIKKSLKILERYSAKEILAKLSKSVLNNFPKVLLIYMPIFAFFLWLFHSKKKWYYFDHGIFTLHYFSFLLLVSLLLFLISTFLEQFNGYSLVSFLNSIIQLAGYLWMFYYFFPAHYRFYCNTKFISFIKSIILLIVNFFIVIILFIALFLYSFISIL